MSNSSNPTKTQVSNFEIPSEYSLTPVKIHGNKSSQAIADDFFAIVNKMIEDGELGIGSNDLEYIRRLCELRKIPIGYHGKNAYSKSITEYLLPGWFADKLNLLCPRGERDADGNWLSNSERDEFFKKYNMTVNVGYHDYLPRWSRFEPTETIEFTDKTGKIVKRTYQKTTEKLFCPFPTGMPDDHRNKMYQHLVELRSYMALCMELENSDIILGVASNDGVVGDKCVVTFTTNVPNWARQRVLYWLSRRDFQCETSSDDFTHYQYKATWERVKKPLLKRR